MLDSNLLIKATEPEYPGLRRFISSRPQSISAITVVEVLGYHKHVPADRLLLESLVAAAKVLPVTEDVILRAIAIRQLAKIELGDALIAATAMVFNRHLLTNNLSDFGRIPRLRVSDPLAAGDPP